MNHKLIFLKNFAAMLVDRKIKAVFTALPIPVLPTPVLPTPGYKTGSGKFSAIWIKTSALATVATLALVHGQALATDLSPLDRQNQIIEKQQQQQLRQEQQRAIRSAPVQTDNQPLVAPRVTAPDIGVSCRDIHEIELSGDTRLIPDSLRKKISHDYSNRCLSVSDIEAILTQLTQHFFDKGLITSRAYLPAQDLRTGKLIIEIISGKIEHFNIKSPRKQAIWLKGAFPAKAGDLLNLRDLEQGIDQINRLSSNNVRLGLRPGTAPGYTIVELENTPAFPLHLYTSYDNQGADSTGKHSLSATVSFDGLLGLNELIAITRRQSVFPFSGDHQTNSTAVLFQLPWGYNTFTINYSQSNYLNTLSLASGNSIDSSGRNDSWNIAADHVLFRNQLSRASIHAALATQRSDNWIGGEYLQISSRRLSNIDLAISGFRLIAGGIASGRLDYIRGVPLFGSLRDADNLTRDLPHASFNKFALDLSYSRNFTIGKIPLAFSTQLSGQVATRTLYGSQQILIGGSSSVRGFLNNSLSGDNGFFIRNELASPWTFSSRFSGTMSGRFYSAFDYGKISNRAAGVPSGALSSVSLGLELNRKPITLDFYISRPLQVPDNRFREGTSLNLRFSTLI